MCPEVTFVLQHAGMPEDLSPEGRAAWRAAMKVLAAQPNVFSKLSAFGTLIHRTDPAHISLIFRETVKIFGANRCLFGSNIPIEKLWTSYRALLDAFLSASGPLDDEAREAVFERTAVRGTVASATPRDFHPPGFRAVRKDHARSLGPGRHREIFARCPVETSRGHRPCRNARQLQPGPFTRRGFR